MISLVVITTGGIIWEVEGRGSGSKGVAYHTDSPTQVDTGGIIWEVEGQGSGSKGVAYHTDSPTRVEDLTWVSLYDMLPLTTTPPTFHLPNNTACGYDLDTGHI